MGEKIHLWEKWNNIITSWLTIGIIAFGFYVTWGELQESSKQNKLISKQMYEVARNEMIKMTFSMAQEKFDNDYVKLFNYQAQNLKKTLKNSSLSENDSKAEFFLNSICIKNKFNDIYLKDSYFYTSIYQMMDTNKQLMSDGIELYCPDLTSFMFHFSPSHAVMRRNKQNLGGIGLFYEKCQSVKRVQEMSTMIGSQRISVVDLIEEMYNHPLAQEDLPGPSECNKLIHRIRQN